MIDIPSFTIFMRGLVVGVILGVILKEVIEIMLLKKRRAELITENELLRQLDEAINTSRSGLTQRAADGATGPTFCAFIKVHLTKEG